MATYAFGRLDVAMDPQPQNTEYTSMLTNDGMNAIIDGAAIDGAAMDGAAVVSAAVVNAAVGAGIFALIKLSWVLYM